ncbi:MAG: hypothetical protein IJP92_04550 [Lachnospiraceae bacterium]|nr:hypothetical protein [Lachnospiraceae bacterium]
MEKKHVLICGERGAGKSTLIQKLLRESAKPQYGYYTKGSGRDENGRQEIYIYDAAGKDFTPRKECVVGSCDGKSHEAVTKVFDTLGAAYIRAAQPDGIIVMDEIGFFEQDALAFQAAILDALDGDIPVLAAVKAREGIPFLEKVRMHPNADLFILAVENRDALYEELRERVCAQKHPCVAG